MVREAVIISRKLSNSSLVALTDGTKAIMERLADLEQQLDAALSASGEWAERYRTAPSTERERHWQDQYVEMNMEVKRLRAMLEAADIDPDENH